MAISKRLRFEVMRRCEFRCYYCGTRGNETGDALTVDHVVPVALGGTDDPENLVAACGDCNAGKSSVPIGSELVREVNESMATAQAARKLAVEAVEKNLQAEANFRADVWDVWGEYAPSYLNDPGDLDGYIDTWFKESVPMLAIYKAFRISFDNRSVPRGSKVSYAGGVIRNIMRDADSRAASLAAGDDAVFNAGYESGFGDGQLFEHDRLDFVAMHIDGRTDGMWGVMESAKYLPWKRERSGT